MTVSAGFRDFVLEQLAVLGRVSNRRMFGGVGLYSESPSRTVASRRLGRAIKPG